jgi:4-amino-4-deoxychorismate lyase
MSPLFETIRVVGRNPLHLDYHTARFNRSRCELFGCTDTIDLRDVVSIPPGLAGTLHRCRVVYAKSVISVDFIPYQRKPIRSLTLVECDTIDYAHKFIDRSAIEALRHGVTSDDILIVRDQHITDTSIANVLFHDGVQWVTPSTPLLPGTARARLLQEGAIVQDEIKVRDLRRFTKVAIINAMVDLDEANTISIENILPGRTR